MLMKSHAYQLFAIDEQNKKAKTKEKKYNSERGKNVKNTHWNGKKHKHFVLLSLKRKLRIIQTTIKIVKFAFQECRTWFSSGIKHNEYKRILKVKSIEMCRVFKVLFLGGPLSNHPSIDDNSSWNIKRETVVMTMHIEGETRKYAYTTQMGKTKSKIIMVT